MQALFVLSVLLLCLFSHFGQDMTDRIDSHRWSLTLQSCCTSHHQHHCTALLMNKCKAPRTDASLEALQFPGRKTPWSTYFHTLKAECGGWRTWQTISPLAIFSIFFTLSYCAGNSTIWCDEINLDVSSELSVAFWVHANQTRWRPERCLCTCMSVLSHKQQQGHIHIYILKLNAYDRAVNCHTFPYGNPVVY